MKLLRRLSLVLTGLFLAIPAMAQEEAVKAVEQGISIGDGLKFLAAGLCISIAACGGGIGQGLAAGRALEAIGRNPSAQNKIFVPLIVVLAIIESLVIYALVIVFSKL